MNMQKERKRKGEAFASPQDALCVIKLFGGADFGGALWGTFPGKIK